jgi:hypothetical protein
MVEAQMNVGPEAAPEGQSKQPRRSQKGAFSGFSFLSRSSKSQQPVVPVQKPVPAPLDTRHVASGPVIEPAEKPPAEAVPQRQLLSEQGVADNQDSRQDEKKVADTESALLSKRLQETLTKLQLAEDMNRTYRDKVDQLKGTIRKIQKDAAADKDTATKNHQEVVGKLTKERDTTAQKNSLLEEQLKAERRRNVKINIQLELERDRRGKAEGMVDIEKRRAKEFETMSEQKTRLLKTLKAEREAVNKAHSERDRLQERLNSEKDAKNRLSNQLEQERESRMKSEKQAEEVRLQLTTRLEAALRSRSKDYVKQQELHRTVGCPVRVRHVANGKAMEEDNLSRLTKAMIQQLKTVRETFALLQEVKSIDYIINDNLYKQFDEARSKLRSYGRGGQEQLLFHGTNQRNINA